MVVTPLEDRMRRLDEFLGGRREQGGESFFFFFAFLMFL